MSDQLAPGSDDVSSRIFLPLRSSVELFSDPSQPPALVRAKQAAVLFEEVIVEAGYVDISILENGSSSWWTPPDQVTTEQIGRARKPAQAGTPFSLAVGAQPAFGTPAPEMRTVMSGPISKSYGAEWHSEVIEPLMALGADWLHAIVTGGESLPAGTPVADTVRRLNFADLGDTTLLPGIPSYERDYIRKAFTRDAAIAEDLDATINVT